VQATSGAKSLREVAHRFAQKWTGRFSGIQEYSAVHLVGYDTTGDGAVVPQMWFWTNWDGTTFHSDSTLQANRASFSDFAPTNNHIPHKAVSVGFSQELPSSLEEERQLVEAFLQSTQPAFTWNGDQSFWRSASGSVGTALDQLRTQKSDWSLDECVSLTEMCLEFLVGVGSMLPQSTVGLGQNGQFDLITVTPNGVNRIKWAEVAGYPE